MQCNLKTEVAFKAASAHVNTLRRAEEQNTAAQIEGGIMVGKVKFLERQCHESGILTVGVQHGRSSNLQKEAVTAT